MLFRSISRKLATANSQLERMNITDPLTGLGNRRHFDAVLPREFARHSRSGAWLSVIMLDIDFFKQFNDAHGHIRGDECLRRVARVIGDCVSRGVDLSARYGGEEFVCLLPETDLAGALGVAEQIRQNIIALGLVHESSSVAPCVTVSLGVASVKCRAADSPEQAVALADAALFRAKSGGRNRVEWAAQAAEGPGA